MLMVPAACWAARREVVLTTRRDARSAPNEWTGRKNAYVCAPSSRLSQDRCIRASRRQAIYRPSSRPWKLAPVDGIFAVRSTSGRDDVACAEFVLMSQRLHDTTRVQLPVNSQLRTCVETASLLHHTTWVQLPVNSQLRTCVETASLLQLAILHDIL